MLLEIPDLSDDSIIIKNRGDKKTKVNSKELRAFFGRLISVGKQSGVNESSLDDRKIYGLDGRAGGRIPNILRVGDTNR